MNGKFMKIKKIVLPILTMAVVASQLMGCASTSQGELSSMLSSPDGQTSIVLEVAERDFEEQGEKEEVEWTMIAYAGSSAFRDAMDKTFDIRMGTNGAREGILFVDAEGKYEINTTAFWSLSNKQVATMLSSSEYTEYLKNKIGTEYADLDDCDVNAAMINAYYNLLPDSVPNYFNGGASLTRAEAMALVMRGVTPVDTGLLKNVPDSYSGMDSENKYLLYAYSVDGNAFISSADGSLSKDTCNSSMSRAEYVYLVMNQIFGKSNVQNADISGVSIADCKDAGDVATEQKFSGQLKSTYTLKYSLDHYDKGLTTELYKSLAYAVKLGIISSDTAWEQAITKTDAIDIFVDAVNAYNELNGYKVDTSESGVDNSNKEESQNAAKIAELKALFNEGYTFNGTEDDLDKAIEKALDKVEPGDHTAQIIYYITESLEEDGFEVKSTHSDETDDETDSDIIEDADPTVERITTAPSEKETSKTTTTTTTTARKQEPQTQHTEPVQTQPPAPQTDPPAPPKTEPVQTQPPAPQTDPPAPQTEYQAPPSDEGWGRPDWGDWSVPDDVIVWGH